MYELIFLSSSLMVSNFTLKLNKWDVKSEAHKDIYWLLRDNNDSSLKRNYYDGWNT
jgi:hypothetical protein